MTLTSRRISVVPHVEGSFWMVFQIVVQSEYENFRLIYVKIKLQLPRRQLCNSFRTFAAHESRYRKPRFLFGENMSWWNNRRQINRKQTVVLSYFINTKSNQTQIGGIAVFTKEHAGFALASIHNNIGSLKDNIHCVCSEGFEPVWMLQIPLDNPQLYRILDIFGKVTIQCELGTGV